MGNLTLSDKYAVGAAIGLLIMVLVDNPVLMLAISVIGILGGLFVVRHGDVRRAGFVAFAAFVIAGALAAYTLVRAG